MRRSSDEEKRQAIGQHFNQGITTMTEKQIELYAKLSVEAPV